MEKKLVFATNNTHKLEEVSAMLGTSVSLMSLNDIGCHTDIPETGTTLEENALIKARYIHEHYGMDCFADDTGLEVDALDGEPGVYSARYAGGAGHDSVANMKKLLARMEGVTDRRARFRTVIALILDGEVHEFEGIVRGTIATEPHGDGGFGYDPVFIPEGYDRTFAELGDVKNHISHRARAVERLVEFLRKG